MRKIAALTLCVLLLAGLCACGGDSASFGADDLSLTVHGSAVTVETPVEEILSLLGQDYDYAEAISCVYEGMDKTFDYADATLYTYPDGDADRLMELYCTGDVQTAKGLGLGASRDDIVKLYGQDYKEAGSVLAYELPVSSPENLPASLYFLLKDGTVEAIAITAEHRAE